MLSTCRARALFGCHNNRWSTLTETTITLCIVSTFFDSVSSVLPIPTSSRWIGRWTEWQVGGLRGYAGTLRAWRNMCRNGECPVLTDGRLKGIHHFREHNLSRMVIYNLMMRCFMYQKKQCTLFKVVASMDLRREQAEFISRTDTRYSSEMHLIYDRW